MGAVRVLAVGRLALLRPRLEIPTPRVTGSELTAAATDWIRTVRQTILPVLAAYGFIVGMLLLYRRSLIRGDLTPKSSEPLASDWRGVLSHIVGTVVGGYLIFLLIVVIFYFVLGGHSTLVTDALRGGSLLAIGVVVPAYAFLSWLDGFGLPGRRRRKP